MRDQTVGKYLKHGMFFELMLHIPVKGAQWLSGRVCDSRPKGRGFEPHQHHCVVSLSKNINPSLVLVQPRKTRPFMTERLLIGRKESNQTNIPVNSFFHVETFSYVEPVHGVSNF